MEQEDWREVICKGKPYPAFQVSNTGSVRNIETQRAIGYVLGRYMTVTITVNKEAHATQVQRLVTEAFLGPIPAGHRIAWRDGDTLNCGIDNLYYRPTAQVRRPNLPRGRQGNTSRTWEDLSVNGNGFEVKGKRLETEIDGKISAIWATGLRPSHIVLDMLSYQLWCRYQTAMRNADEAIPSADPSNSPETAYRAIPIVAIPQVERVVSVTVAMTDYWPDASGFLRAVSSEKIVQSRRRALSHDG